jgi:PleD family two-component response regulator
LRWLAVDFRFFKKQGRAIDAHQRSHVIVDPHVFTVLRDLTIVIVEDHDDVRRYLGVFLSQLGAKVLMARNGFEGFEAIKNNHPHFGGV